MPYAMMVEEAKKLSYEEQLGLIQVLVDALKANARNNASKEEAKKDCSDTYPEGYFDLFGSIDDQTFVEPEELPWELDAKREFF